MELQLEQVGAGDTSILCRRHRTCSKHAEYTVQGAFTSKLITLTGHGLVVKLQVYKTTMS